MNDFKCNEREIMKCSNSLFFSFLPIMHLLPGPKTKLSNTLSGPLFQQVLSTRETRSRRCSVRVVEFRLSLPGTVSVSLNLWFVFVCDGSFYHRLNLLWLAFRSSNFFFYLKTFSLFCWCCSCEENHNYCRRKQSKPKLTEIRARKTKPEVAVLAQVPRSATLPHFVQYGR